MVIPWGREGRAQKAKALDEIDRKLDAAEELQRDLRARKTRALEALDARMKRNHWKESIEQLMRGTP